jgi:hypothetical protein
MEKEPKQENPIDTLSQKLHELEEVILKDWYLNAMLQREGQALAMRIKNSFAQSKNPHQQIIVEFNSTKKLLQDLEVFKEKALRSISKEREAH